MSDSQFLIGKLVDGNGEAAAFFLGADPRPLPHTVDANLEIEKALFPALRARGALEMGEAA